MSSSLSILVLHSLRGQWIFLVDIYGMGKALAKYYILYLLSIYTCLFRVFLNGMHNLDKIRYCSYIVLLLAQCRTIAMIGKVFSIFSFLRCLLLLLYFSQCYFSQQYMMTCSHLLNHSYNFLSLFMQDEYFQDENPTTEYNDFTIRKGIMEHS